MRGAGRNLKAIPAATAAVWMLGAAPAAAQRQLTPREIAAKAQAAVLVVSALGPAGDTVAVGTGFVVREDGVFVTNYHVIEEAASLRVATLGGKAYGEVYLLAADAPRDLAVLRVDERGMDPLPLGRDTEAEVGDRVYLMGNPLGMNGTFADGLVSARRPVESVAMLQLSAPISPGSSGGPVMNERGEVIGVATLFADGGQNLSLAVPVRYVHPLLEASGPPRRFVAGVLGDTPPRGLALLAGTRRLRRSAPRSGGDARELPVVRHFETIRSLLRLQDLHPAVPVAYGAAAEAGERAHEVRLDAGVRYLVAAHCDPSCGGVELGVLGDGDLPVPVERAEDGSPALALVPPRAGTYRVVVRVTGCSAERCAYGVGVFRAAGGAP